MACINTNSADDMKSLDDIKECSECTCVSILSKIIVTYNIMSVPL